MSINITDKPEMNVVNIGDELTQDQLNAITSAGTVNASNPFITQTRFFNSQLYSVAGESSVTLTPSDFASGWTSDVVSQALSKSSNGWIPIKITITLEGPTQGISSPALEFHIFEGDRAAVIASTATVVAKNLQNGSAGRYTITPESGEVPRYEWVFEYTPIQMAGARSIYPNMTLTTSDSNDGDWIFGFTIEATAN